MQTNFPDGKHCLKTLYCDIHINHLISQDILVKKALAHFHLVLLSIKALNNTIIS